MTVVKNLRTFWFMLCLYARQSFYHKSVAMGAVLTWCVRTGLTIILYHAIYQLIGQTAVRNITFDVAVSGMMFFALFGVFGTRTLGRVIGNEYKLGGLDIWFTKPLPYLLLKLAQCVGENIPALLGLLTTILAYWGIVHHDAVIDHGLWRLACAIMLFMLGLILSVLIYGLVGLSAIFLAESKPVFFIVDKLIMVFGGIYIPIGFFPSWFRCLGETLPTGAINYGAQFLYPDFFVNLPRFVLMQLIWLVVLGYAVWRMNRATHKHLTVNGG